MSRRTWRREDLAELDGGLEPLLMVRCKGRRMLLVLAGEKYDIVETLSPKPANAGAYVLKGDHFHLRGTSGRYEVAGPFQCPNHAEGHFTDAVLLRQAIDIRRDHRGKVNSVEVSRVEGRAPTSEEW